MRRPLRAARPPSARLFPLATAAVTAALAVIATSAGPATAANDNPPEGQRTTLLTGDVSSRTGAYTHTLPIELPPARRGTRPTLALVYDSASDNGLAGVGWHLSGLPAIVRVAGDTGLRFDGRDTYAFSASGWSGGMPGADDYLVGKGSNRYHRAKQVAGAPLTEFQWDASAGTCGDLAPPNASPCAWIMKDGLGNTYKFGTVATARLSEPANGVTAGRGVIAWALYQVIDSDGNYWQVSYSNTGATLYPTQVEYNLPRAGATPRSLRVDFEYAARTDPTPAPQRFTQRLSRIRVQGLCTATACSLIRQYRLGHSASPVSGRSLLTSFQEFGSDGDTGGAGLPAQTFTYTAGTGAPTAVATSTGAFTDLGACQAFRDSGKPCAWQSHIGDLDGDGKDDVVRFFAGETGPTSTTRTFLIEYTCGRADGLTGSTQTVATAALAGFTDPQGLAPPIDGWRSVLTDIDGDGKQDLVVVNPTATPTTAEQQVLITGIHLWAIAYGGQGGACSFGNLTGVNREQVRTYPFTNGHGVINQWSVLPTDGDGRGQGGVTLIDHTMNLVHEKFSTGTGLGQTSIASFSSQSCRFRQWQSGDINGDGRQDLDAFDHAGGEMCFLTSAATGPGGGGNYAAFTNTVQPINPPTVLAYQTVRAGDLNGDGRTDFLFNYQGAPTNGVGRDLRYWLGATTTGANPIRLLAQDGTTYPGADLAGGHLNQWEYLVGDVTGDGLDDYVQIYLGSAGTRIFQALSTPTGPGPVTAHTSNPTALLDGASAYAFPKWHAVLADLDGDGLKDLAYGRYGNLGANPGVTGYYRGTPTGLATTPVLLTNPVANVGGDSRNLSLRTGDVNGDGKDDLIFLDDNIADPLVTVGRIGFAVAARNLPLATAVQDRPDLLRGINNGLQGTRAIDYKLAGDFTAAVAPTALGCNGGAEQPVAGHWATGATCGIAYATPRPLVARVVDSDGRGFVTSTAYDYYNGRAVPGWRSQRADLGFGWVRTTDEQTTSYRLAYYRQQKPFQGQLRERHDHGGDLAHTRMSRVVMTYGAASPFTGVTAVQRTSEDHAVFASTGAVTFSAGKLYAYDPLTANLVRVTEQDDQAGHDAITDYGYRLADLGAWTLGRLDSVRVRATDATAPGGFRVLAMQRLSYDDAGGRPWRLARFDELQFDRFDQAACASDGDPWLASTCQGELSANLAHWVTRQQGFVYDGYGNLTSVDGVRTQNDDLSWNHRRLQLQYDPNYLAHLARVTNDLGHVVEHSYDRAGRVTLATDVNSQATVTTYDPYGRLLTQRAPGQAGLGTRIDYAALGDIANQRYEVTTWAASGVSSVVAHYFDGHGREWQLVDRSPSLGNIYRQNHRTFVGNRLVERHSDPYFAAEAPRYAERRYDFAGRLATINRVSASFAVVQQQLAATYHDDGSVSLVDAAGRSNRVYKNTRGLTTRVTDAAGGDTRYLYNAAWLTRRVELPNSTAVDLAYDGRYRPYSILDPATGFRRFTHDDAGNLGLVANYPTAAATTPTSRLKFTYDVLDRRRRDVEITAAGAEVVRVTYTYDALTSSNGLGRLTSVADPSGSTTYAYDPRGNLHRRVHALHGLPGTYTYQYSYNDRDQLIGRVFPSGSPFSTTDQGSESYLYTADGMLTDVYRDGVPWAKWNAWNAHKKPTFSYRHWNGVEWAHTTDYAYDPDQRLAGMGVWTADGELVVDNLYTYDAVGNLATITDRRVDTLAASIETDSTQGFSYDALGRLTGVTDNLGPAQRYGYDPIGNLVSDTGTTTTTVACGAQTCTENRTGPTLNWRTYQDSEGKRTRFDDHSFSPVATFYYTYDYRGQLTAVVKDGVTKETFQYDHAGRRTHETFLHPGTPYTTTAWSVGDGYTVRQASDNTSRWARTVSVGGVAQWTTGDLIRNQATEATALAQRDASYLGSAYYGPAQGTYLDVNDHKGSPMATSHPDGSLVNRHWLDAWGSVRAGHSSGYAVTTADRFNGFATSDYSRLLYAGSRYYHPKTRRFLTADDRVVPGGAQGFNRYAYATNNPASYREDGHQGHEVATSTPDSLGSDVFTAMGGAQTGLMTVGLFADAFTRLGKLNPYSLGAAVLSVGMTALIPTSSPEHVSRYFGAISMVFQSEEGLHGTGRLLSNIILHVATASMTQEAAVLAEFGTLRLPMQVASGLSLVSVATINAQLWYYTYQAMAMTPQEALDDFRARHPNIAVDPNIVLTPDGGYRWKTAADRDAEQRLAAQRSGVGYPIEPGADTDAGGDSGGGGPGIDGLWEGPGSGFYEPVRVDYFDDSYSESSNGSTIYTAPW